MDEQEPEIKSEAFVVAEAPAAAEATAVEAPGVGADGAALVGTAKGTGFSPEEISRITDEIIAAIKTVYDPEIPVDIYELGLIYKVDLEEDRTVRIDMTLTAPGCPVAGEMPVWVDNAVRSVEGIADVEVAMVFDPPWDPSRMSEEAQVALNWW
jgi:FeS assembly SUF system protein